MKLLATRVLLSSATLLVLSVNAAAVTINTVPVGNVGNAGEVQSQGTFGAVAYDYLIATTVASNIPEPTSLVLAAIGLAMVGATTVLGSRRFRRACLFSLCVVAVLGLHVVSAHDARAAVVTYAFSGQLDVTYQTGFPDVQDGDPFSGTLSYDLEAVVPDIGMGGFPVPASLTLLIDSTYHWTFLQAHGGIFTDTGAAAMAPFIWFADGPNVPSDSHADVTTAGYLDFYIEASQLLLPDLSQYPATAEQAFGDLSSSFYDRQKFLYLPMLRPGEPPSFSSEVDVRGDIDTFELVSPVPPIPEPSALALGAIGILSLCGLLIARRRALSKKRRAA
jgi:hypothetical protein